jgi:outer membrane lipoprotein-sorting protein
MMRASARWLRLLFVAATAIGVASAGIAAEFTADVVHTTKARTMTTRVYVKGQKVRHEIKVGGSTNATILRPDKGVMWMVNQRAHTYMEEKASKKSLTGEDMEKQLHQSATGKFAGKQNVSGFVCNKYVYAFKDKKQGTMTEWFAPKLGFKLPIKIRMADPKGKSMTIEYRNIHQTKLSDALFQLPAGYRKVSPPKPRPLPVPKPGKGGKAPRGK